MECRHKTDASYIVKYFTCKDEVLKRYMHDGFMIIGSNANILVHFTIMNTNDE